MPAPPSVLPVWNTGGLNRNTPSAGIQALGWVYQAPTGIESDYFNWWQNLTYQWVDWTQLTVGVEHNNADGTHTNVTALTVAVSGDANLGDNGAGGHWWEMDQATGTISVKDAANIARIAISGVVPTIALADAAGNVGFAATDVSTSWKDAVGNTIMSLDNATKELAFNHVGTATPILLVEGAGTVKSFDNAGVLKFSFDPGGDTFSLLDAAVLSQNQTVTRYRAVDGSDFTPATVSVANFILAVVIGSFFSCYGSASLQRCGHALKIPDGVTLTEFALYIETAVAGNTIACTVYEKDSATGVSTSLGSNSFVSVGAATSVIVVGLSQLVNQASKLYFVRVDITNAGATAGELTRIHGGRTTYTTNKIFV